MHIQFSPQILQRTGHSSVRPSSGDWFADYGRLIVIYGLTWPKHSHRLRRTVTPGCNGFQQGARLRRGTSEAGLVLLPGQRWRRSP